MLRVFTVRSEFTPVIVTVEIIKLKICLSTRITASMSGDKARPKDNRLNWEGAGLHFLDEDEQNEGLRLLLAEHVLSDE